MPNDDLRRIEAVLFAAERPLTRDEIALYMPEGSDIAGLLASLGESYAGRGVELAERGGKWHFQTAPDLGHILRREDRKSVVEGKRGAGSVESGGRRISK